MIDPIQTVAPREIGWFAIPVRKFSNSGHPRIKVDLRNIAASRTDRMPTCHGSPNCDSPPLGKRRGEIHAFRPSLYPRELPGTRIAANVMNRVAFDYPLGESFHNAPRPLRRAFHPCPLKNPRRSETTRV